MTLVAEQPSLAILVTAISPDRATRMHDAMARNEELDPAMAQGVPSGTPTARAAGCRGHISVGPQLTEGDRRRNLEYTSREAFTREPEINRCRKAPQTIFEISIHLRSDPRELSRGVSQPSAEQSLEGLGRRSPVAVFEQGRNDSCRSRHDRERS